MIKEPYITLNMNGRSLSWFREKGYIVKQNSTIEIKPFDLPRTSKTKVTAICEECGVERVVTFADYSPICRKCSAPKNSKGLEYKGVNNPNYNHNMSEEERAEYKERSRVGENKDWTFKVKEKYSFTCHICGDNKGGNLNSHHLNNFATFKESRLDISNGVCLCEKCHKDFHKIYGYKNIVKEQYLDYCKLKGKDTNGL